MKTKIRCLFSTILLGLLLVISASAITEEIRDYYAEPGLNPFKSSLGQFNESIDPFSGTLQQHYVDLEIPGNGGLDIVVSRTYTSPQGELGTRSYSGVGWTLHFGRIVVPTAHRTKICSQSALYSVSSKDNPSIEFPDGRRERLVVNAVDNDIELITKSNWKADCKTPDNEGMRVISPDGVIYYMTELSVDQHVVKGQVIQEYSWYTKSIEDLHGNTIDFKYMNASGSLLIDSLNTSDGRVLDFSYTDLATPDVRLSEIISQNQTVSYKYDRASEAEGYWNLKEVRKDKQLLWQYDYYPETSDGTENFSKYALEAVTYPYGGTVSYTYAGVRFDQLDIDSQYTTVVESKKTAGPGLTPGEWRYEYIPASDIGEFDKTVVTKPNGREEYLHQGLTSGGLLIWPVGLLYEKSSYASDGTLLDVVVNSWDKRLVSNENWTHGRSRVETETYAPILTRVEHWSTSTPALSTSYNNHNSYGSPTQIIEECALVNHEDRVTNITYYTNPSLGIVNRQEDQEIVGIGLIDKTFDDAHGWLNIIDQFGVVETYTYTTEGDLNTKKNARNYVEIYSDYYRGNPQTIEKQISDTEWVKTSSVINPTGTVHSKTDGEGNTVVFGYDGMNRLTKIDYPIHADVTISYPTEAGYLRSRELTRGSFRLVDNYDGLGRTTSQVQTDLSTGETVTVISRYDALGQTEFTSYPNSDLGTTYTYDALGRVTRTENGDGSFRTMEYGLFLKHDDGEGRAVYAADLKSIDEKDNVRYSLLQIYGADHESVGMTQIINSENGTFIERDAQGKIKEVRQGEYDFTQFQFIGVKKHTYEYDSRQFLINSKNPETGLTVYGRDAVGNQVSYSVGESAETIYTYDGLNRMTAIDYPNDTPDVTLDYDANDNLVFAGNDTSSWVYGYDENNNNTSEELSLPVDGGRTLLFEYGYDELDAVSSLTYPNGYTVNYNPNALGRPTTALPLLTSASYYPNGQIASLMYLNGVTTTIEQDARQYISRISSGLSGAEVNDLEYNYYVNGDLKEIINHNNAAFSINMTYDGINRLETADGAWGFRTYTYNAQGDISKKVTQSSVQNTLYYHYDKTTNRLIDISTSTLPYEILTYDNYGNQTNSLDGITYQYNDASQLIAADINADGKKQFYHFYDGNGHLHSEIDRDKKQKIYRVHNQSGELLYEENLWECKDTVYVKLGSTQIAKRENDSTIDANGNGVVDCLEVSSIIDSDSDGIPDAYEFENGLDPVADDSQEDNDNDGVSNYEEYLAGTKANNEDTDGDNINDQYEITYGLDPLIDDAQFDLDSDGASNYNEYIGGTDPSNDQSVPAYGLRSITFTPELYTETTGADYSLVSSVPSLMNGNLLVGYSGYVYLTQGDIWFKPEYPDNDWPMDNWGDVTSKTDKPYVVTSENYLLDAETRIDRNWRGVRQFIGCDPGCPYVAVGEGEAVTYYLSVSNAYGFEPVAVFLKAYDNKTGEYLWTVSLGTYHLLPHAHPSIGENDVVYVPITDVNGPSLAAYDKLGTLLWQKPLTGMPNQPAIGFDGTLYVSTTSVELNSEDYRYVYGPGKLYALDPDGSIKWSHDLAYSPARAIIGMEDIIYVAGDGPTLNAYTKSGELLWTFTKPGLQGRFYSPVIGKNGVAYFVHGTPDPNEAYHVNIAAYAVDIKGVDLWSETDLPGSYYEGRSAMRNPILSDDGTLYFWAADWLEDWSGALADQNSRLFSFFTGSRGMATSAWPAAFGGKGRNSRANRCQDGDTNGNGIMDCAELERPVESVPSLKVALPTDQSIRYWVNFEDQWALSTSSNRLLVMKPDADQQSSKHKLPLGLSAPVFKAGDQIEITGTASDRQDGDISASITWMTLDGQVIGTGNSLNLTVANGMNRIKAVVVDSNQNITTKTFAFEGYEPASLKILSPKNGDSFKLDQSVEMECEKVNAATNIQLSAVGNIAPSSEETWRAPSFKLYSGGLFQIKASVFDKHWIKASDTVEVRGIGPLTTRVTNTDTRFSAGAPIHLTAVGVDPSGYQIPLVTSVWSSDVDGYLGGGEDITVFLTTGTHLITIEMTDELGQIDYDSLLIEVTDE